MTNINIHQVLKYRGSVNQRIFRRIFRRGLRPAQTGHGSHHRTQFRCHGKLGSHFLQVSFYFEIRAFEFIQFKFEHIIEMKFKH